MPSFYLAKKITNLSRTFSAVSLFWVILLQMAAFFGNPSTLFAYGSKSDDELTKVREVISAIETSMGSNPSHGAISKQLELATWRILLAEMLYQQGDKAALWSSALDLFEDGLSEYLKVEEMIKSRPELESELAKDPNLAMRLDSARGRMGAIRKRQELSREQERLRLNELREIAGNYKQLLADMSQAELMIQVGNFPSARELSNQALLTVTRIYEIADRRKDYNLLKDEPEVNPELDLAELQKPVSPLADELVAGLKAQYALATVKLAISSIPSDKVLLDEAIEMAQSVIDGKPIPGMAPGSIASPNDLLANYVLGVGAESTGIELTRERPYEATSHQKAELFFSKAKKYYALSKSAISKLPKSTTGLAPLAEDLENRQANLNSPDIAISDATTYTASGDVKAAIAVLRESTLRHHSPKLWASLLDACRRGNQPLLTQDNFELKELFENQLIDKQSEASILSLLQYWNAQAAEQIGKKDNQSITGEFADAYKHSSSLAVTWLEEIAPELRKTLPAFRKASISLAKVYGEVLHPASDSESLSNLKEAHRLARDAMDELQAELNGEDDGVVRIPLLESLGDAQIAYGQLSMRTLPDHRDDAVLAFAAANDTRAKLPFASGGLALQGSPLIEAIRKRGQNPETALLIEERELRSLAMEVADAAIGLKFGQPSESADTLRNAIARDVAATNSQSRIVASEEMNFIDGFEDRVSFTDAIKAFGILAAVAGGKTQDALRASQQLVLPGTNIEVLDNLDEQLPTALKSVQSPLTGCAVALALEASLNDIDITDTKATISRSESTKQFVKRALTLYTESKRFQGEYPEIGKMIERADVRASTPDYFLTRAKNEKARGDFDASVQEIESGLRLHPNNRELWASYWSTEIEQLRRSEEGDASQLSKRLTAGSENGLVTEFQLHYFKGLLHQFEGNLEAALNSFDKAAGIASSPTERIQAIAKSAEVRTKLAATSN